MDFIHDKFFRASLACIETAENFFREYLPDRIVESIDLNTLEEQKGSYIEENYRIFFSDILYKVNVFGEPTFFYFLIEHKSDVDKYVSLQLMRYMLNIWEDFKEKKKGKKLPTIVPIVLYHGKKKWKKGRFIDLFDFVLVHFIPNFHYLLYDIAHMDIKQGNLSARWFLLTSKYKEDVVQLSDFYKVSDLPLVQKKRILFYVFNVAKNKNKRKIFNSIIKNIDDGESIMVSIAEGWKQEGIQEGVQQTKIEAKEVIKRIKRGDSAEVIHETTGYTVDEINELKTLILE